MSKEPVLVGYSIERNSEAPILIVRFTPAFSVAEHLPEIITQVTRELDASPEPVHYITDTREARVTFADIVQGLAKVTRGASGIFAHPNIAQLYFVATHDLVQFAVKALSQTQYGSRQAVRVETVEEALAMIEQELDGSPV